MTAPGSGAAAPGRGPRTGIVIGAGLLAITTAAFVRPPLLPDMGRDLDLSPTGLGALGSVFALGRILTDIPVGRLTDTKPSGRMLAAGAALVGVGSVVSGLAPVSAFAFVGAFVLGIGSAWTNTTGMAAFATAPRHRRGVAMSAFAAGLLLGQAVGPAFGGLIAAASDWRVAFFAAAGLMGAVAAWLLLILRSQPAPRAPAVDTAASRSAPEPTPRRVLAALYLLPAVQFGIGGAMVQTLVPIVGDAELGLGAGIVGLAIGLGGLFRLAGAVISGWIADHRARRWALFPGLLVQLAGLVVFAAAGSRSGWAIAIGLVMLGSVGVNVGATILADLTEGGGLGRRLGMFRLTGDLALLAAPVLAGALYDVAGRGISVLPLIVFVAAVIAFAFFVVPETVTTDG